MVKRYIKHFTKIIVCDIINNEGRWFYILYEFTKDTFEINYKKGEIIQLLTIPSINSDSLTLVRVKVIKNKLDVTHNNQVHGIYAHWLTDGTLKEL